MVPLLLLPLLWGGSLQEYPGYQLRVQELVTVQEGLCVLIPCSFSYPWDSRYRHGELYIYWFCDGDYTHYHILVATNNPEQQADIEAQGRFRLLRDPRTNNCSLSIRDAKRSDTGVYSFRVERGYYMNYSYRDKKLNLQVADMTEKPNIHFPEPLESGRPTKLICSLPGSCEGGRPLTFSWVGDALDSLDPKALQSSVLTLTLRPQDHGTKLTCQVKLQGSQVTTERTIQLHVFYAPRLMTTSLFQGNCTALKTLSNGTSLPVLEGQFLRLVCVADSTPPARMSWSQEGKAFSSSKPSAPGVPELPQVGAGDGGKFTNRAQNPLGSQHVSFSLSAQRSPFSCSCVTGEQQGSWPLVVTLIRGTLMGAGFLLTYGLTWIYYTRCGGPQGAGLRGLTEPPSISRWD
ncbi:PREDICTED: sialic acid-binding Ig-like lectin 14 [Ceratotherium simum simum]|uniref:Sialic acid-binding Ig-like lectin 14 n=1 Tax=Ceratotherium simum simum TaxID=73337 RepID=A0ABM0I312_CERSS|nr:PREDICTED: sialic acid-binding Ig-like lectin 14 [Ceratotherium simum simum]